MCGIYGIAIIKGSVFNQKLLRMILKKLAINSKIRGRDATGYAFSQKSGINVFKHNVFADQFVKLKNYKEVIRENLPGNNTYGMPYSVIGHTRSKTKGCPKNPLNNHPIRTGSIVGVHNGVISNDDSIFKLLNTESDGEVTRIAEVDSEAIFAMVNYYAMKNKFPAKYTSNNIIGHMSDPTSKAIAQASSKLIGSYACALIDADSPKYLWLFKGCGQLVVHYYREEKLLIFASTEAFIEDAVKLYGFSDPDSISINTHSGLCVDTETGKYDEFKLEPVNHRYSYNSYMGEM